MLERVRVPHTFTVASLHDFKEQLAGLSERGQARAVILTGGGDTFSIGLDLRTALGGQQRKLVEEAHACFQYLRDYDLPLVAEVDGAALAGGVAWAALSDVVVASERAEFQLPEATFGLPPYFVIACLRERMSPRAVTRLTVGCARLDAVEALAMGLVDIVVSGNNLASTSRAQAHALARPGRATFRRIKAFAGINETLPARLDAAAAALQAAFEDDAIRSGVEAYADALGLFSAENATMEE